MFNKLLALLLLLPSLSLGDMHSDEIVISCKGDQGYNYKTEEEFEDSVPATIQESTAANSTLDRNSTGELSTT